MHELTLSDCSEVKLADQETVSSPAELKRWWLKRKKAPFTMWDLQANTFSARFALGNEEAGGVMIANAEGEGPYSFLIEGTGNESIAVRTDGFDDELAGRSRISAGRLLEVLTHLMEHGEIGPGKWETDGEIVDTQSAPEPRGRYSKALIQLMKKTPARKHPLDQVLALIGKAQDDDFKAFLDAFAHHQAYGVSCGDWMFSTPEAWDNGDIQIGTSGGGDPYLMRGRQSIVVWHETGEEETYSGFEGLLADLVFRAHDRGKGTDLDAITGEEPY